MFGILKRYVQKIYATPTEPLSTLLAKDQVTSNDIAQIRHMLLQADVGVHATQRIMDVLQQQCIQIWITGEAVKAVLIKQLVALAQEKTFNGLRQVIIVVGANGTGKTTTIAKLAASLQSKNKKVLLAAADTFRAAAVEQLEEWAQRLACPLVRGMPSQDPAAVAYQACEQYKQEKYDYVIIDTAGRLQTKANLMNELGKLVRVVKKQVGDAQVCTLLTIDGMLGQNSFEQAKLFHACAPVDGVILTKMDGSGKGGMAFAIVHELHIPIAYVTFGENQSAIHSFDASEYVDALFDKKK